MLMQLTSCDPTHPTIRLPPHAQLRQRIPFLLPEPLRKMAVYRRLCCANSIRPRQMPRPLELIRPVAADGQGHRAVQAAVDGVEVTVCEAEAGAVDGVEEVEDGKVQFAGEVHQCKPG